MAVQRRHSLSCVLRNIEEEMLENENDVFDSKEPTTAEKRVTNELIQLYKEVSLLKKKAENLHMKYEDLEKKYNVAVKENENLHIVLDQLQCDNRLRLKENETLKAKIKRLRYKYRRDSSSHEYERRSVHFDDEDDTVCI